MMHLDCFPVAARPDNTNFLGKGIALNSNNNQGVCLRNGPENPRWSQAAILPFNLARKTGGSGGARLSGFIRICGEKHSCVSRLRLLHR